VTASEGSGPPSWTAEEFEVRAAERVASLPGALDLDTFAATFDLLRLANRVSGDLEARVHGPAGWSMAGFRVMFVVWVGGGLEPRAIARLSGLSRAAVSSVLNTLERDELVVRARESADRRLVTVRLTADGEARLLAAYQRQNRREAELFGGVSRAELRDFTATLRRLLVHRLNADEEPPGPK
jgi:DNA-binding MarR family transcriptional regulator